ncbi:MAG: protein kinase [Verrucomicrobiota bacterium]|nr:protein kinase [Verrucomicrobiota bacterium]
MSYKAPRRADGGDLGGRSVVVIPNEDASDGIDPIIIACFSSTQLYQDPVIAKGEGRSRIRLGIDMRTGARYALVIRKDGPTATSFESSITVLKKCAGPGVVKLVGSLTYSRVTKDGEQKKRMLVLPYYSGGSLMTALQTGKLTKEMQPAIAKAVVDAISRIHRCGFAHCDIKPENVLVEEWAVALADFEYAQKTKEPLTVCKGTVFYIAPELTRVPLSVDAKANDLWALGITLYSLFVRKHFLSRTCLGGFEGSDYERAFEYYLQSQGTSIEGTSIEQLRDEYGRESRRPSTFANYVCKKYYYSVGAFCRLHLWDLDPSRYQKVINKCLEASESDIPEAFRPVIAGCLRIKPTERVLPRSIAPSDPAAAALPDMSPNDGKGPPTNFFCQFLDPKFPLFKHSPQIRGGQWPK